MDQLELARAEFEREWRRLRGRVRSGLGTVPRRRGWWILALASAVGVAAGLSLRRRDGSDTEGDGVSRLSADA